VGAFDRFSLAGHPAAVVAAGHIKLDLSTTVVVGVSLDCRLVTYVRHLKVLLE